MNDRHHRRGLGLVGMCCAMAMAGAAPAQTTGVLVNAEPVPSSYIVVLEEDEETGVLAAGEGVSVSALASDLVQAHGGQAQFVYEHALHGFSLVADPTEAESLAADPYVAFVEQDSFVSTQAVQANPPSWGIDRIDERSLPRDYAYAYGTTAANVHAYVIDTGIRASHQEFAGRIGNGFSSIGGGTGDCHGHGTHVAGTLGGTSYGVAKQVRLHPIRVLDCAGSGTVATVIAGIDWVTASHVKPAVANMSLATVNGHSVALDLAVTRSTAAGITYVAAAGNENVSACNVSPARAPAAITVGASSAWTTDFRADFSNWGPCLDIFAPGHAIVSASHASDAASATKRGTSMAAPHVAGVAALFLSVNPGAAPALVADGLAIDATAGVVADVGPGSPNRLVHSLHYGLPIGNLELVEFVPGGIRVVGWAIDPDTSAPIDVHVYVDNAGAGAATANRQRVDVGSVYPGHGSRHGFDVVVNATAGRDHGVCVYAINAGPGAYNPEVGCKFLFADGRSCGLLGIEALLPLGAVAFRRRGVRGLGALGAGSPHARSRKGTA